MFGGQEWIVVALIVLLLFGSTRLPKLARSMREAKDEFSKESKESPPATEAPQTEETPPAEEKT